MKAWSRPSWSTPGPENVKVNALIAKLAGEGEALPPRRRPPRLLRPPKRPRPPRRLRPRLLRPPARPPLRPAGLAAAPTGDRVFASPLARRLASAANLDLESIKGTGPHGRVVKADVEAAAGKGGAPAAKAAPAAAPPAPAAAAPRAHLSLEQQGIPAGSYDLVPLDGMRKTIARRLTDSFRDVPHFPLVIDLEIDALLAARAKINPLLEGQGVKVSVNDIIIKAAAVALKRVPEANASCTPEGIAVRQHADIAVAVADRRRPDHPDRPRRRDQGPGADPRPR